MKMKKVFYQRLWAFMTIIQIGNIYGQQLADESFNFAISNPAYRSEGGPLILFDEAHNNGSTLRGTYSPFGKLLRNDGYQMSSSKHKITPELLSSAKIYVTVNAISDPEHWELPVVSAYGSEEIGILKRWVAEGGSLFLITDHMPCGGAAADLAAAFNINVLNGFAIRDDGQPEIFSKERRTLLSNEITDFPGIKVDSIMCWGGTGFIVPPSAKIISQLGKEYKIYLPVNASQIKRPVSDSIPSLSAKGFVNGAYFPFGKGRVVIFGDGAPFSAQLQGIKNEKRGMNHPGGKQNAQLLLNIIHWLDRRL